MAVGRSCAHIGCQREHHARGLCNGHYRELLRLALGRRRRAGGRHPWKGARHTPHLAETG